MDIVHGYVLLRRDRAGKYRSLYGWTDDVYQLGQWFKSTSGPGFHMWTTLYDVQKYIHMSHADDMYALVAVEAAGRHLISRSRGLLLDGTYHPILIVRERMLRHEVQTLAEGPTWNHANGS